MSCLLRQCRSAEGRRLTQSWKNHDDQFSLQTLATQATSSDHVGLDAMGGSAGLQDPESQHKAQRNRMCRSTRPAELRVPLCLTMAPRCRGGTTACTSVLLFFSACFRPRFPGAVHRAAGTTTPVLSASTVPIIAEGTFPVLAVPRLTPSAPRSKPLLGSVANLLLASYPIFDLYLTSVSTILGIAAR